MPQNFCNVTVLSTFATFVHRPDDSSEMRQFGGIRPLLSRQEIVTGSTCSSRRSSYSSRQDPITITMTTFQSCSIAVAGSNGGILNIASNCAGLDISDCVFHSCTANSIGGAIYAFFKILASMGIVRTIFDECEANSSPTCFLNGGYQVAGEFTCVTFCKNKCKVEQNPTTFYQSGITSTAKACNYTQNVAHMYSAFQVGGADHTAHFMTIAGNTGDELPMCHMGVSYTHNMHNCNLVYTQTKLIETSGATVNYYASVFWGANAIVNVIYAGKIVFDSCMIEAISHTASQSLTLCILATRAPTNDVRLYTKCYGGNEIAATGQFSFEINYIALKFCIFSLAGIFYAYDDDRLY